MNPAPPGPEAVEAWIFDLDNTLYPASAPVAAQVSARMTGYLVEFLGVDEAGALALRKGLFREHGTTLRGLMLVHGIDPLHFLDYVHDIDLGGLPPATALGAALDALPGRKLVHTNASTRHAERILDRLGLTDRFSGIFDIAAADWVPKPEPAGYAALVQRHAVVPARAAMVEDIARNLKPAAESGMLTLWVRTPNDWAVTDADADWVHHHTDDLAGWLAGNRAAPRHHAVRPG